MEYGRIEQRGPVFFATVEAFDVNPLAPAQA